MSSSPEGFFYLRNNFLVSHGTSSLVSWIMSIDDRHADNLLISKVSGESIPIDFGHAFGSACFLPIPALGEIFSIMFFLKARCHTRFQCAFTACCWVFIEITMVGSTQYYYFENSNACSKRTLKTRAATSFYLFLCSNFCKETTKSMYSQLSHVSHWYLGCFVLW